jgi:hypothetical protein
MSPSRNVIGLGRMNLVHIFYKLITVYLTFEELDLEVNL